MFVPAQLYQIMCMRVSDDFNNKNSVCLRSRFGYIRKARRELDWLYYVEETQTHLVSLIF